MIKFLSGFCYMFLACIIFVIYFVAFIIFKDSKHELLALLVLITWISTFIGLLNWYIG